MAQNVLKMKYHPAKKAVEFEALQDGVHFSNYTGSALYHKYETSTFVLQQHGHLFFEAIKTLFNGAGSVDLEVTTTKTDYEDLEQMVEYYNREKIHQKSNFRIVPTLEAVLPDMEDVYMKVRDYGKDAITILDSHRADFHTINSNNAAVQESIEIFSNSVQEEINNIRDKVARMDDNNVNLCFAGIYSAGKSSLINAILGHRILPERVEPTTARSFRIRSPKAGEAVHVEFLLSNERMILTWNEESARLSFSKSLAENASIQAINALLEKSKDAPQHEQIYQVLDHLNAGDDDMVNPVIDVYFPIPLDRENVHFTVLDTPGTDSNTVQHREVLRNALKEQESSILIFVAPANHATDGHGNQDLLDLLQDDGKAIDIDRSLFILNYADSVDSTARNTLKNSSISATDCKSGESFQIDLITKKLFFTSAKAAYIAKAVQNDIATKEERKKFKILYVDAVDEEFGCYYQDNHCATSDCATDKMLKRCQSALKEAEGDQCQELFICSGLFALEDEIIRYGEKYASAVRAHAIIDGVDQALVKMSGRAASLAAKTDARIEEIEKEIAQIKNGLMKAIEGQRTNFSLQNMAQLSNGALKDLHLDWESWGKDVKAPLDKSIKKKLGWGEKVKFSEKQRNSIAEEITSKLTGFEKNYIQGRKKLLEEIRKKFLGNVKEEIRKKGEMSPEARDFICEITPPCLKPIESKKVNDIFDDVKKSERFLIFSWEYFKKKDFLTALDNYFDKTQEDTIKKYKAEFGSALNSLLSTTASAYMSNLEEYSVVLKAKRIDKVAMEKLMHKIQDAAAELEQSMYELNQIIWGGCNDET